MNIQSAGVAGTGEHEMRTELSARIAHMQQKLSDLQPVARVHADTQLFVTSDQVCRKLVALANVRPGCRVLEPSAGTGAIVRAVLATVPGVICQCVEMNAALVKHLSATFPELAVTCADFLSCAPQAVYDRIIMNPPFSHGEDIKHIRHALKMLAPGGNLVAVCANGPRQQREFKDITTHQEILPRGTFAYTNISTMIVRIDA